MKRLIPALLLSVILVAGCSLATATPDVPKPSEAAAEPTPEAPKQEAGKQTEPPVQEPQQEPKQEPIPEATQAQSPTKQQSASKDQSSAKEQAPAGQEVEINRTAWTVPADWEVVKGLDSVVFKRKGEPIGGIDGLGYSPTVENLLPNHTETEKIEELKDFPTKTYKVTLKRSAPAAQQNAESSQKEVHFYFYLGEKVVYDLYFNLAKVADDKALQIAKSIKLK